MFNRIAAKVSSSRHKKLKHEKPSIGSSRGAEDLNSENAKATTPNTGALEIKVDSSHVSEQGTRFEPDPKAHFQKEITDLTQATYESSQGDEDEADIEGARTPQNRLLVASQALNRVIDEYLKGNPDPAVIDQLQKVHRAISPEPVLKNAGTTDALRSALSKLPESMTGRKKRWATNVGDFLSKLYPLTAITLGLAASGAEVGISR